MQKSSKNQLKIIKETNFGQGNSLKTFSLKFAKLSKINDQTSIATEADRYLP